MLRQRRLFIIIKPTSGSSYKKFVDIMNELQLHFTIYFIDCQLFENNKYYLDIGFCSLNLYKFAAS